jgi:hypothetical protein
MSSVMPVGIVMAMVVMAMVVMAMVVVAMVVTVAPEMLMAVAGMTSATAVTVWATAAVESVSPVGMPIHTVTFGGLLRVPLVLAEVALVLVVRVAKPSAVG